jgi:hypothetical protein
MEQIETAAGSLVATVSQPKSNIDRERALMVRRSSLAMPALCDRRADLEIPRAAWDSWKETGKPRCLRRPLTAEERSVLERRRDEIAPWMQPYHRAELDQVAASLLKMFGAFPAFAGGSDVGLASKANGIAQDLAQCPAWAIVGACDKIRTRGYAKKTANGNFLTERHWPPSDPEIAEAVEREAMVYRTNYDSAVALLTAQVAS